jgi:hypothetical protein
MHITAVITIEPPRFLKAFIVGNRNCFVSGRTSCRSLHLATEG